MIQRGTETTKSRSAIASYFSLFSSVSTLLCCALPSVLVLVGMGATVATVLSRLPWLVALSRYKHWTFTISGLLIASSFVYTYVLAPRWTNQQECPADDPSACETATRASKIVLWLSAALYCVGFFVAILLGPILARMDAS